MTTGLLIGVYILVMGRLNVDQRVEDPVKAQAVAIAKELISVRETHQSFGLVGLCDSSSDSGIGLGGQSRRVTSLNSVKATLHAAALVARGIGSKISERHIIEDLDLLEATQDRLLANIFQVVEAKEAAPQHDGSNLHSKVMAALRRNEPTDMKTVSITIQLGQFNDPASVKTLPAPASESSAPYIAAGYFRANHPVPVCADRFVRFYPFGDRVRLVEPANFIAAAPGAMPNAVLLEVRYEPRSKSTTAVHVVRRVCALLGGKATAAPPTCFLFRFPQGNCQQFKKPSVLLDASTWLNAGTWQQASGGTVPGSGKLKLTIAPVLPVMAPQDSLAIGLYHWIRHLRPAPDPNAILKALNQDFPAPAHRPVSAESPAPVNSCLVTDTGARERGFVKNTDPGGDGQRAIKQCFEYAGQLDPYPQNAVPLYVDRSGSLNLAGRTGFDSDLVSAYLNAVFATNLAGLESIATTKLVRRQSALETRDLERKLLIKRQELVSATKRVSALSVQRHGVKSRTDLEALNTQIGKAEKGIDDLKSAIAVIEQREAQLRIVNELARITLQNAERATSKTYDLCATTFTMLRNGLHSFDPPVQGYLLGRKMVFLPLTMPVKESDFFEAAAGPGANSEQRVSISPWFQKQLPVLVSAQDLLSGVAPTGTIDKKSMAEIVSEVEVAEDMPPLTVIIDSRELSHVDKATLHYSTEYPFAGTPVLDDQAFYYSKSATITGANKNVVWSVVMRDLVFHQLTGTRVVPAPTNTAWEKRMTPPLAGTCGLAVEFQLRRPLPRLEGLPAGAYITDPNKRLMTPQIPPVPVELM